MGLYKRAGVWTDYPENPRKPPSWTLEELGKGTQGLWDWFLEIREKQRRMREAKEKGKGK